jgi:Protein of unknown function (DUF1501)
MTRTGFPEQPRMSRREWLRLLSPGVMGYSMSGWLEILAADAAKNPQRKRSCILLWMNGGPSQMDTFDLKPGHANGGPFKEIQTSAPGLKISEHLPKIATFGDKMAVIRSMSTKEADHGRATYYMRTGYMPTGPIQYPPIASIVSKELGSNESPLPNSVSIGPYRFFNPAAYGPGFLGPQYAPLIVGDGGQQFGQQGTQVNYANSLKVENIDLPADVDKRHADARLELLQEMHKEFMATHPGVAPVSHQTAYDRAVRLMKTAASKAFNLDEEPDALRDAYGQNLFGQGCLLARRLVEQGVPFVEVTLSGVRNNQAFGWDTHADNFTAVRRLSEVLDPAWGTLMEDLKKRGLLDSTLIVWMGEFGRTPLIAKDRNGRDHWPNSWTTVLAGGGIKGGQAIGKTSADGGTVEDRPVSVPDLLSTVCLALGIDPTKQYNSNVGRPIRIADKVAKPLQEILA